MFLFSAVNNPLPGSVLWIERFSDGRSTSHARKEHAMAAVIGERMMAPVPGVQHSNLTRESSQKSSALWRQRLEYYFWQGYFCGLRRQPVAACIGWSATGQTEGA